jgi:hypothetical protein
MHGSRLYLLLPLLGLCLVASGCEWAGFGERDPRQKVAAEVDKRIADRLKQRELAEQEEPEGTEVSVVVEVVEFPTAEWNTMLSADFSRNNGESLRREVQILIETEEARLREQLVLRARPGRESVVSLLRKGGTRSGSILKLEPTDLNPPMISLNLNLQVFGLTSVDAGEVDEAMQRQQHLDFSASATTRRGDYAFLGTLNFDGEEDASSKGDSILLLFLRADFF